MLPDPDTFIIEVYACLDRLVPPRPRMRGARPKLSDSQVMTLMVLRHWLGRSQRGVLAYARTRLVALFPEMLSPSAFNRRCRALEAPCAIVTNQLAMELDVAETPYQLLDSVAILVARRCRGEQQRLFGDDISIGRGGSDRSFYYGTQVRLAVTASGVITGWVSGPAATETRWLCDYLLLRRYDPTIPLWTRDDVPSSRHRRTVVGPTGPRFALHSCGQFSPVPYKADDGFAGRHWNDHWQRDAHATVITCRDHRDTMTADDIAEHHRQRQRIETVNHVLLDVLHLGWPRMKTIAGIRTHIAETCAAFNLGLWLNRKLNLRPLAIGALFAG